MFCQAASDLMTGSAEDIVATNVGIKVEKIGKLSFAGEYVVTSILMKLPNLTVPDGLGFHVKTDFRASVCTTLDSISSEQREKTWENFRAINAAAREKVESYLKSRITILNRYIIPLNVSNAFNSSSRRSSVSKKKKRQAVLLGLLGGSAMLALGGVTEYQIHQISQHVRENSDKIEQLKNEMNVQRFAMKNLGETVFAFVKNVSKTVSEEIDRLECSIFLVQYREFLFNYIDKSFTEIDNVLWTALSGSNSLLLTPRMLEVSMLRSIVEKHSILRSTIYRELPSMLYSIAKVSLIEIDTQFSTAHFTLRIPILSDGIMPLFKSSQVGTFISENTCMYFNLPGFLYKWNGIFHPIDTDQCLKNNDFYICPRETLTNETACIQEHEMSCPESRIHCNRNSEYRMSIVGLLIRNNVEGSTFAVREDGITTPVVMGNTRTAYVDWKGVSYVQIGKTLIRSPNVNIATFTVSNFSIDPPTFDFYLDSGNITRIFDSICKKYNTTLDNIMPPLIEHWKTQNFIGSMGNLIWHVLTTVAILIICSWLICDRCLISRFNNKVLKHQSDNVKRRYSI